MKVSIVLLTTKLQKYVVKGCFFFANYLKITQKGAKIKVCFYDQFVVNFKII